ncbi:hypothetical protein D6T65_17500 [Arthrobacter frigidicola]|nr:hypothetical protein D6T65_17500 [Arthrobacter frigidicola]
MQKDAAPYKSPVVLAVLLIILPLLLGAAFAAVAFVLDLVPNPLPTDVGRSGISGTLAGLAIGAAVVLQLRRGVNNGR